MLTPVHASSDINTRMNSVCTYFISSLLSLENHYQQLSLLIVTTPDSAPTCCWLDSLTLSRDQVPHHNLTLGQKFQLHNFMVKTYDLWCKTRCKCSCNILDLVTNILQYFISILCILCDRSISTVCWKLEKSANILNFEPSLQTVGL